MKINSALAMGIIAVLLVGCTSGSVEDPDVPYQQPGWMAEIAAWNESFSAMMKSCMNDAGYQIDAELDGGIFYHWDHEPTPEERDARQKASETCSSQTVEQLGVSETPDDHDSYLQLLDTTECLHRHGYPEIGDPPSEDVWIDSYHSGEITWSPYGKLDELYPGIVQEEWYRLKAICVEGPIKNVRNFPPPPTE